MLTEPTASSTAVSSRMRRRQSLKSALELDLRRRVRSSDARASVYYQVFGRARHFMNIAFPRHLLAVFIHRYFWHGCPELGSAPVSSSSWWRAKLRGNRSRDANADNDLRTMDWMPIRLGEHISVGEMMSVVSGSRASLRDEQGETLSGKG